MASVNIYDAESYLDFRKLHLYDRGDDISILTQAYGRSFTSSRPQIVWLKGNPGVGKSALVEHLFLNKDYYCSGKFERLRSSMPYSAMTALLCKLCYTLEFEDQRIESLSSDDELILAQLVPEITNVLQRPSVTDAAEGAQGGDTSTSSSSSCNLEWGLERLKQALRGFLRAVCDIIDSPLILFLDDLQWADLDTLEILSDLLIDDGNEQQKGNGILFIGAYRDTEVEEDTHPLVQCMQTISERTQQESNPRILELHITNLDEIATNQLVADLTSSKTADVAELSKVIHSKTAGNCFYTLHTLRYIHERKLLCLSKSTLRWEWDSESINEEVQVSDNVADFMTRKLKKLPQPTLHALTFCAFVGTKIELELLEWLFHLIYPDTPPLQKLLQPAATANLIEMNRCNNTSRKVVRFTHDRVTDAAYNMIPEGIKRKSLHLRIGWSIHSLVLSNSNDDVSKGCDTSTLGTIDTKHWQLILAVDQLNRGADLLYDKREQVLAARLNLLAAQQVLQTGAFKLATGFLETGLQLVGFLRWRISYDLTLQLSVTLASVLYSNGRMEKCQSLLDEIFENVACPEDRYEAHSIQLEMLESTGQIDKALQVGLQTLEELGHPKIPRKPHLGHVVFGFLSAKKALKRMTDEDILSLPICTDPTIEFFMRHLNCLSTMCYYAFKEELMVLTGYHVMQMSLRSGLTRYSPSVFASHAFALGEMGDFEGAFRFATLSIKLMERFPTDYRTSSMAYCVLYHLKKPIHECINSSLMVYNAAFSKGDLRSAGFACFMHIVNRYCAGLELTSIAKDTFAFCSQLKKYQQSLQLKYLLFCQRAILELMGRQGELSTFLKNADDDEEFESFMKRDGDMNGLNHHWLFSMEVRFRLGDLESALEFGEKSWRNKGASGFFVSSTGNLLFSALTALEAWKKRRKRRHWRMFRKCHKEIGTWLEKGNLNSRHVVLLLDAELAVMKKQKPDKVRSMYESSISLASRSGFVPHSALANERAGQYFLEQNDKYWAEHYLTNAHELYTDWSGTAKVEQMAATYRRYITPDDQVSRCLSFDGTPTPRRPSNFSLTGRSRLAVVAQVEAKRADSSRIMRASVRMPMPKKLSARRLIANGA